MNDIKEKLCVVMPVYNEQAIIGTVLEKWDDALLRLGMDYEIRPYNDGSKDDSLAVMRKVAEGRAHINVKDKPNGGHGNTILTAYREAVEDGFDWVFQIDSDDEMEPEKFSELWSKRGDYDFLVGMRDGRKQALPRKIISFVSRLCVRVFYGKSVWDVNTPYRLMRVSKFAESFKRIPLDTFAPNVILSGIASRNGLRCFETPVPQHDRATGEVSIKKWKLLKAAAKSFRQTIGFAIRNYHIAKVILVSAISLVALMHIPEITMTVDGDWHIYALGGKVLNQGGRMYINFFDHKGPFVFLVNALGWWLWPDFIGTWIIEWTVFAFALVVFWRNAKFRFGELAACIAVLLLLLMKTAMAFYGRPESFAVALSILAIGSLMGQITWLSSGIAGGACAVTLFMKQTLVCPYAGIFLFFLIALKGRRLVAALTAFLGAFMIIALGVVGYMHVTGVLPEFWKDCFVFNYLYQNSNQYFIHGFSSGSFMQSVYDTIRAVGAYIGFAIAGGVYMAVRFPRNSRRTWIAVVLGWSIAFVLDLALVSRCGRIYGYQCDPLRFWCVLALMPLVKECDAFFRSHNEKRYCALPITLAFLPIVSPMLLGELARIYLFIRPKTTNELKVAAAIEQIKEWPESPVMVWGNCGKFYLKSGRKFVSKYYSWTPFYVDGFLSDDELKETLRSILEERTIVVDKMSPDPVAGEGIYEDGWIHGLPKFKAELRNLLNDHYMARDLPGGARLYLPK